MVAVSGARGIGRIRTIKGNFGKSRNLIRISMEVMKVSAYKIFAIVFLLFILINHLLQMTKFRDRKIGEIINGVSLIAVYALAYCLSGLN